MKTSVPVSMIIPVYNVREWIDQCMESVVNQTFLDFEVILVNDGSNDGSELKCQEWADRDRRIKVITKKNEGPSKARNEGIQKAAGTYIVFLDADDWLDVRFLEIMYQRALETDADIVECDVYRYNDETGEQTYRVCSGRMGMEYTLEEHMKYGDTAIWKCMFRKALFLENGIFFPDCHSSARAIYALLLALSNRIENVHEALYYYRRFRKGSLTAKPRVNNGDEEEVGIQAIKYLIQGFKRCGLYENYQSLLEEIIKVKLSDLLAAFFYRKEKSEYRLLAERYYSYIEKNFPATANYHYITLGGYNLNRILMHMNLLHDPYCRFNFSSIISIMNPIKDAVLCTHKNRYREIMIEREIRNQFWDILKEMNPHYLFLDLIEERFDLVVYESGYLTKSDALEGGSLYSENMSTLSRDSDECRRLWEKSGRQFISRLKENYPETEIVLIKNYLSEKVGNTYLQKDYDNLSEIQKMNQILKGYYDFFEKNCEDVKVIEASQCDYYFTDQQYEYGAIPSHLNEIVNREIAKKIEKVIDL